jgi:choline dehydrogenase
MGSGNRILRDEAGLNLNSGPKMLVSSIAPNSEFDFVIAGAGSAGCVLANRLTQSGQFTVLLIEAGGPDNNINIHIPVLVANLLRDERFTWPFMTEPQLNLNGKPQLWVRGKVLGGSGSINGGLFVRGDPLEYDSWREQGCKGWGYSDLLPYFKQLEDYPAGDPTVRGRGGPIGVTKLEKFDELSEAFVNAADSIGFHKVSDYNDGTHYVGTDYLQVSTRRGLRSSSSVAYLRPAKKRPNLTVLTRATATRVLLENKRATGLEVAVDGQLITVRAKREVILSAGPLQSPKLLELSGIGNEAILRKHGIATVHHLPSVGENLRDHPSVRVTFECTKPITINDILNSPWKKMKEGMRFIFKREGLLTISSTTARVVLRSQPELKQPDITLRLQPRSGKDRYSRTRKYGSDDYSGFSIGVTVLQPRSTGHVHIKNTDPMQQAAMDPQYLSHEDDLRVFVEGVRLARKIAGASPLRDLVVKETRPGAEIGDDPGIVAFIRENAATSWHMVGTCKMGIDAASVVDPELRVNGISALRVIDSSIFPTIPSTNTNAPTLAAAEKGAAMILDAHRSLA